jgi:GNAT superfamily N-acetyltransferase
VLSLSAIEPPPGILTDNRAMTDRAELQVRELHAAQPPASELLAAMAGELDALYAKVEGTLDSAPASPEQMSPPGGCFLLISRGGEPIACGGVKQLDPETAEIKRMYVTPDHRGGGVGRLLLAELERRALDLGYGRVRLDTGPEQPAAKAIYDGAGYRRIDDYNGNPYAAYWFEKRLIGRG